MSTSKVAIANLALTMLSTSRILDFEEEEENARKIKSIYDHVRDSLLAEHNWNFARAQANLAQLDETPTVEDYVYAFQLPNDCIRVIRVENDYDFMIISNKLYSNNTPAHIEYIKQETDPTKYSKGFIRAFATRLAADLAYGVTTNATLAQFLESKAQKELTTAKQSDAQEGTGTRLIHSQLITARQE